jgi:3'(2'), 5'-bisphosphate nucleotidase
MNSINSPDNPVSMNISLDAVREIASDAAHQILKIYETDFNIEHKDDRSPLTAADMAAHKTIIAGLKKLTPDIPIVSEESSEISFDVRSGWSRYWLVDPLDGTREFIKRNGEFTVNIALIEAHEPVIGIVHVPVTGICYYAGRGQGAHKAIADEPPELIKTRKVSLNNLSVAGSRSHGSEKFRVFVENLGSDIEVVAIGSSLKSCLVAEGKVDIYPRFGPTSEWDTAAAQCVVEEAGGLVTDMQLQPLYYNTKPSFLNPSFLVIGDPDYNWRPYLPLEPDEDAS